MKRQIHGIIIILTEKVKIDSFNSQIQSYVFVHTHLSNVQIYFLSSHIRGSFLSILKSLIFFLENANADNRMR